MSRLAWGKFVWSDWESDPALSLCSMAAQGLWMRLLCIASKENGYVLVGGVKPSAENISHIVRAPLEDVQSWLLELETKGVFSRTGRGEIYSRRMVKDFRASKQNSDNGKKGGNPSLRKNKGNSRPLKAEKETELEQEKEVDKSTLSPVATDDPKPAVERGYPEPFDVAWKAYPHVKGRSSKPKSLIQWRRLSPAARLALIVACSRYAAEGREPKAECGAPAMDRWLAAGRYEDWLSIASTQPDAPVDPWPARERNFALNRYWNSEWGPNPDHQAYRRAEAA